MDRTTAGPGGFASSGPFAPRPGVTPVLAHTRELVGVHSGPAIAPAHHPPVAAVVFGLAVLAAAVLAIVNTAARRR